MSNDESFKEVEKPSIEVFSFGDPEPVNDGGLMEYFECYLFKDYYEPPIPLDGLATALKSNVHHQSAISIKRNQLVARFIPHPLLGKTEFAKYVYNYLVFGNAYIEKIKNRLNGLLALKVSPTVYTRRKKDGSYLFLNANNEKHHFRKDTIFHLFEPDLTQEIYGVPDYLPALQSCWLNESATLFRRKYYLNGSHAGFVMYITDPSMNPDDIKKLRQALKESKGPGNFKNMLLYSPNGQKDGLKVIPIAEIMARDEFLNVKNITRDDVLAAHRVPPQLMGVIPSNTGGFGDAKTAMDVFIENEIVPIQGRLEEVNDWLGESIVQFKNPTKE